MEEELKKKAKKVKPKQDNKLYIKHFLFETEGH